MGELSRFHSSLVGCISSSRPSTDEGRIAGRYDGLVGTTEDTIQMVDDTGL